MNNFNNFLNAFKKNNTFHTFVIAEAGVHHGCNLDNAKKLIDAAAHAGADAIKFQTYKAETLVTNWAPKYWQHQDDKDQGTQFDFFKRRDKFEYQDYAILYEYAQTKNIVFCSTPFDTQSVKWLEDLDIPFWKVASADIDNFPLLEQIAQTKKPIILSTGASYFNEIQVTVNFLKSKQVKDLALLHCNLAYPTPHKESNLSRIVKLKQLFPEMIIGYSDHTIPDNAVTIPVLAVALGAEIIEKHFTLDRMLPEDDHNHSLDAALLQQMIHSITIAEDAMSLDMEITDSEKPARINARRSLVAKDLIPEGSVLSNDMIIAKRPGGGISPSMLHKILSKKTKVEIKKDQQILHEHIA